MNGVSSRLSPILAPLLVAALALSTPHPAAPEPPREPPPAGAEKIEVRLVTGDDGEVRRWVLVDGEPVEEDPSEVRIEGGDAAFSWVSVNDDGENREIVKVRRMVRPRAFLGVFLLDLTEELRRHFGGTDDRGVLVSKVVGDSPAAEAGLHVGDLVVTVDGEPVRQTADLLRQIAGREAGDAVEVEALRAGVPETFTVVLSERERLQVDVGPLLLAGAKPRVPAAPQSLEIDPSRLSEAFNQWTERLESPEYRQRYGLRQSRLEDRILELEARLLELEGELEALAKPER